MSSTDNSLEGVLNKLAPEFDFTIKFKDGSYRVPKATFAAQSPVFHCAACETGQKMAEANDVFEITADVSDSAVQSFICWMLKIKNPEGQRESEHHKDAGTKKADLEGLVILGHTYQIAELLMTVAGLIDKDMEQMGKEEFLKALSWLEKCEVDAGSRAGSWVWFDAGYRAVGLELTGSDEELESLSHPLQIWLLRGLVKHANDRGRNCSVCGKVPMHCHCEYDGWDPPKI